ncbi:DUF2249 domain-containing protein [Halobaculum sp. D14]|uniref:DUF2249 domain-containing protein n=1 Tax=Halobaculum sp. D14 TaxID=3421642 RepID=UPI003EBA1367
MHGDSAEPGRQAESEQHTGEGATTPPETESASDSERRELDAREIDGEPFGPIMAALDDLPADGTLVLYNSFEPEPLYGVVERRGFTYETTRCGPEEWKVTITHA